MLVSLCNLLRIFVAGLFFVLPCTDTFVKVDMRIISFDIPPQEILTKDSVTVSVDGVVYYRVQNAILAVANITNADSATRLLAQTTLRNVLGTKNLAQLLSDREEIAHNMQNTLDEATDDWGIKVERVEIKDVKLPVQLQRAMAAEAEASREARAKVIAAEGEMNASRALKEASIVISESPAALQLRYLQTLTTIASGEKLHDCLPPAHRFAARHDEGKVMRHRGQHRDELVPSEDDVGDQISL
ncbi:hypothetical protein QTO34_005188 [Cnephaeus nilssonii]|uniref:Band 7 domain-containing protein n=1 Tax=Cnephaeus nilssonii TaxID=3371016 RepID=A0AA40HMX3_CNENI|nr:hypothetical protein QTO34_005188 [Eptesicus nilssonii]